MGGGPAKSHSSRDAAHRLHLQVPMQGPALASVEKALFREKRPPMLLFFLLRPGLLWWRLLLLVVHTLVLHWSTCPWGP